MNSIYQIFQQTFSSTTNNHFCLFMCFKCVSVQNSESSQTRGGGACLCLCVFMFISVNFRFYFEAVPQGVLDPNRSSLYWRRRKNPVVLHTIQTSLNEGLVVVGTTVYNYIDAFVCTCACAFPFCREAISGMCVWPTIRWFFRLKGFIFLIV